MNISFKVPDMTCNHCVKSITNAIHTASPDSEVLCELDTKKVTVSGEADMKLIENAIKDAGYSLDDGKPDVCQYD